MGARLPANAPEAATARAVTASGPGGNRSSGIGSAGLGGARRADPWGGAATLDAVAGDALEHEVVRAPALVEGEGVERQRARVVGDHRGPGVRALERDRAVGEGEVVGEVDVPAVRRAGTDALGVVVTGVVARDAGAGRAAATGHGQLHVGEGLVVGLVRRVGTPDGRAERALAHAGDVGVLDVADAADAGMVTAALTGTDLLHDRRRDARHGDVAVVHVGDLGAVHRHHAQAGLAGAGDGDGVEDVVGEVATGLRAEHQGVAAPGGQVRVGHPDVALVGEPLAQRPVALEHQGVVVGGVGDVGDLDVGAVDDVPTVPVTGRRDGQVVGGDAVTAVDQRREVAAAGQRDLAEGEVLAVGQRDDLVSLARAGVPGDQVAAAGDRAAAGERDVGQAVPVEHRVVEVAVPVVLELVVGVRLGVVVPAR